MNVNAQLNSIPEKRYYAHTLSVTSVLRCNEDMTFFRLFFYGLFTYTL